MKWRVNLDIIRLNNGEHLQSTNRFMPHEYSRLPGKVESKPLNRQGKDINP